MMITMIKPWDFDPFFFGGVAGLEVTGFSGANWILSDFKYTIWYSYWKWSFIVSFPIKNGDFP